MSSDKPRVDVDTNTKTKDQTLEEIKLTVFHPLDKVKPHSSAPAPLKEDDDDDDDNDLKKSTVEEYGEIEEASLYPPIDDDDMDQFCQDAVKMGPAQLKLKYSWTYANMLCFWLRNNNDRLGREIYKTAIAAGDWDKVKYLIDLLLPTAAVLEILLYDTTPDCPIDIFAHCFDAVCRGEIQCPYCSTTNDPLTRNECDHTNLWQGLERDELYEDRTIADDIYDRASSECLTMHLNALLKRPPHLVSNLRDKCLVILRNSRIEEYDALMGRLFPQ